MRLLDASSIMATEAIMDGANGDTPVQAGAEDVPISAANAKQHPPPSLNSFRTAAARAPANSKPALWFWQMTGDEWPRDGHSFDIEKKRHRRMV